MDIKILYEDDSLAVIDKPRGVVVNRAESVKGETVQDFSEKVIQRSGRQRSSADSFQNVESEGFWNRSGVAHRLDKETSGVLIIAKKPEAFVELQKQFKERRVDKVYTALVHGKVVSRKGKIKVPVGRLPWDRKKFGIVPEGRQSITEYYMKKAYFADGEYYSLLELRPVTGRTHQIRVHLKYIGHPIVSDEKYVGKKRFRKDVKFCPRMFLHAGKIAFEHPVSGKRIEVESELQGELRNVLNWLDKNAEDGI